MVVLGRYNSHFTIGLSIMHMSTKPGSQDIIRLAPKVDFMGCNLFLGEWQLQNPSPHSSALMHEL
jgi:hypothetical protein